MREKGKTVKENRTTRRPVFYALVFVCSLVVIFIQLVRQWDQLLVVDVTWTRLRENEGVIAFELKNSAPVPLRVLNVGELYPLPEGVAIGAPQASAVDGGAAALPDHRLGPRETVRVSVPVVAAPHTRVREVQLGVRYEVLGFWKIARVPVSNLDL